MKWVQITLLFAPSLDFASVNFFDLWCSWPNQKLIMIHSADMIYIMDFACVDEEFI